MRVLAATFALLAAVSCTRLPPELEKIECPQASQWHARSGHEVLRLGTTKIVLPCRTAETRESLEARWKEEKLIHRIASDGIGFMKTPKGRYEVSDRASAQLPPAAMARYTANVTLGAEKWAERLSIFPDRKYYTIPTPPAFAATGAETVFECHAQHDNIRNCMAKARSRSIHWFVVVSFGFPNPAGLDVAAELTDAYGLLAAHIVSQ